MPSVLGSRWIVPQLGEFIDAYPSVSLEIVCTDFVPPTIGEGLDVAVQIGELHDSTLAVRRLACPEYVTCASPQYLAQRGTPKSPPDLKNHRCLRYRRPRNGRLWDWRFRIDGHIRTVAVEGLVTMNSHEALVSAAAVGLGIIQVASYYAHSHIQSGNLVEILEPFKTEGHIISAVFSKQQPFPPKIRAFVDFLAQQFSRSPWSGKRAGIALSRAPVGNDSVQPARISHVRSRSASNRERSGHARKPNARA
jgi:LysR family transcriptional regulator, regulator for bpeEF and oprC